MLRKTLLFVLALLAIADMTVAQDVYTSGYRENPNGSFDAVVYKNGTPLYTAGANDSYEHDAAAVLYYEGDVYWVDNYSDGTELTSDLYRNNEVFLHLSGNDVQIFSICAFGEDIYAAGAKIIGEDYPYVIWKNNDSEPYLVQESLQTLYEMKCYEGLVVLCGENMNGEGIVWGEGDIELYNFGEGLIPMSMDFYQLSAYSLVWDFNSDALKVYRDNDELYTLSHSGSCDRYGLCIDAGDVYVVGEDAESDPSSYKVWKNGNVLCGLDGYAVYLKANSEGVFCAGYDDKGCVIWKDGQRLYTITDADAIWDMSVAVECEDLENRTLPYFEGFEKGVTDWKCWTVSDEGENYGLESYWMRSGLNNEISPATGNHCAVHNYGGDAEQEGWLISPPIMLEGRGETTLRFKSYEDWPTDMVYEAVLVSSTEDENFVEVWSQTDAIDEWKEVQVDLTAYQGQSVYIAFKYMGIDGHVWYIDDINIESTFVPVVVEQYVVTLEVSPAEAGSVTGAGTYNDGTTITIAAVPNEGYTFEQWNDGVTDNPRTLTVTADITLVAQFKKTGVNEFGEVALSLYPNPAKESLHIEGLSNDATVEIYNNFGMLVKTLKASADEINVSDLSAGLYTIRCGNQTMRFVKE